MKEEHLYEKIEAYLNGDLSVTDRKVFEEEMAKDVTLQKEVRLHSRLHNELSKPNKKLLRDNLKTISAKQVINLKDGETIQENLDTSKSSPFKWWPFLLLGLAFLLGAYYFTRPSAEVVNPIETPPEQKIETPGQLPQEPTIEQPTPTQKSSTDGEVLHQANNDKIETSKQNEKPLIASANPADFKSNPYLDNQIGNTVRGESYSVVMDASATAETMTLLNGVAQLRLKGALKTDGEIAKDASFVLMIYTNKKEDYLEDRSILNVPINLQPLKNDAFPFQFNANLRITPGLYYYIIAEKDNDEPLHVGKFEVQSK